MWFWRNKSKSAAQPVGNQCSFCSQRESETANLFSGYENTFICGECLEVAEEIFRDRQEDPSSSHPQGLNCSFCLRSDQEVKYLVAGPTVYICDNCVLHFRQTI